MSITITAIPFLLLSGALGASTIGITEAITMGITEVKHPNSTSNDYIYNSSSHIEEEQYKEIFNKNIETEIMDTNALIKTLEEHGAENISQEGDNISCNIGNYQFFFFKEVSSPYVMKIQYSDEAGLNHIVDDINSEYRANAQEISYNKIKERLEAKNLSIDEEEIYDDNTIVLTVNLE